MKEKLWIIVSVCVALAFVLTNPVPIAAQTPAPAKIKWMGQTHIPSGLGLFQTVKEWAAKITTASGGRLELVVHAPGTLVPGTKEFDGVNKGVIDFGTGGFTFWVDRWPGAALFAQVCGEITPTEKFIWYTSGGGIELARRMVKDYNVHLASGGGILLGPEAFLHTKNPIKTLADLKRLKVRAVGDGAAVLSKMGVSIVFMGGAEIYEAMSRNVLDGFELGNLPDIYQSKIYEVVKYIYMSPVRAPHEIIPILFNKSKFNALPEDLKLIVENITQQEAFNFYSRNLYETAPAVEQMKKAGVKIEILPPEIESAFLKTAKKHYDDLTAKDAFAKEVLDSLNHSISIFKQVQPGGV